MTNFTMSWKIKFQADLGIEIKYFDAKMLSDLMTKVLYHFFKYELLTLD